MGDNGRSNPQGIDRSQRWLGPLGFNLVAALVSVS